MFRTLRIRLVALNAAVLLLVLSVLCSWLYAHMRYRLFRETDEMLRMAESRMHAHHNQERPRPDHAEPEPDDRTIYLFWDAEGRLAGMQPDQAIPADAAGRLRNPADERAIRTVKIDGTLYRMLQFPASPGQNSPVGAATIGVLRSLEDVENTLRLLRVDIAAGIAGSVAVSVGAGLFLAGRALIPIRRSWEKQQQFVADASHELRTPAAIVQAQTEMLLRSPAHTIEQESPHIAVILKESKQMSKLLDDLLTLARSDSNQLQIQPSAFALDALLRELAAQFELLADAKGIAVSADIQEPLSLWGDEGRIRQLLIILLDNALKYTPPSGRIEIAGRYQSQFVYVSVTDNGSGIAKEDLPHVFERFYRGDKVRSRAEGGTGLGLSIARWIVDAHGGTIRMDSKVDQGTKVEVLFPRKKRTSV